MIKLKNGYGEYDSNIEEYETEDWSNMYLSNGDYELLEGNWNTNFGLCGHKEYGFELVTTGISNGSELALAADNLISRVDCVNNLTDNTVVQGLPTILEKAGKAGVPVFGSELEQVKAGCLAAVGLDYVALGRQTGKMAAKVLKGEAKASEQNFELISEYGLYLNTKVASDLGLALDEEYVSSALESYDSVSAE